MKAFEMLGCLGRRMWTVLIAAGLCLPQLAWSQSIVLNELLADNQTSYENGPDFPDYIELYNRSAAPVDLAGMGLTDDDPASPLTYNPMKFRFLVSTVVQPGAFFIVFADDKTNSPGIHTGFGMNNKGETITLTAADFFTVVDRVPFGLQLTDRSVGRVPDGTGAWTLNMPTAGDPNEAVPLGGPELLSINEWMALRTAQNGDVLDDWLELYSGTNLPVHIGGLVLSDASVRHSISNLSYMAPFEFLQLLADDRADRGADHLPFKLSSTSGETVTLYAADGATLINQVAFEGGQLANISEGRLPDGAPPPSPVRPHRWTPFPVGRDSPGRSNFLPYTNVVFNEILSHTDEPLEDAIELYNPNAAPADISHFWLSDERANAKKFRIPPNTIIPPGGYKVFYQGDFDPFKTGVAPYFSFNSFLGEEINLFSADAAGTLTGSRLSEDFGAAGNGVSFGRYLSAHVTNFVPMAARSFGHDQPNSVLDFRQGTGLTNPGPNIGPVVISEIMYHPRDFVIGTNIVDNSIDEYIELRNISTAAVGLFHPVYSTNTWKVRDAVTFQFPMNFTLNPGASVLLVNFDPVTNTTQLAVFRNKYSVPANVPILGAYKGKLGNASESLELARPDTPQTVDPYPGFVPYLLVDRVKYGDKSPWPSTADGTGRALSRVLLETYGNEPANWTAALPSPGRDDIRISAATDAGTSFRFRFDAKAGSTYSVFYQAKLGSATWTKLADYPPQPASGFVEVSDSAITSPGSRFYRVVTPAQ